MHQLDFIINWNIAPLFDRFRVSNRLLLEVLEPDPFPIEFLDYPEARPDWITLAYVGMEDETNYHKKADSLIDLFLLTCALISDFTGTYRGGASIPIPNLEDLGNRRVLFKTGYKTLEFGATPLEKVQKPITLVKNRFLQLESDIDKILTGYLGLALRYFSYAIQSYQRKPQRRIEETVFNLAISAETLFTTGKPTKNLKERLPTFIADDKTKASAIAKQIGQFYNYRSDIVHGRTRKHKMPIEEINLVKTYIKTAIDKALSLKLYEKKDLLNLLK